MLNFKSMKTSWLVRILSSMMYKNISNQSYKQPDGEDRISTPLRLVNSLKHSTAENESLKIILNFQRELTRIKDKHLQF